MNDRVRSRLEDALEAAGIIQEWSRSHSRQQLEADLLVESAYVRQFEVIGEALRAARSADDDLETYLPQIHEWVSLRHHIIHEYREVDLDLLWQYTKVDVPTLIEQLEVLLKR